MIVSSKECEKIYLNTDTLLDDLRNGNLMEDLVISESVEFELTQMMNDMELAEEIHNNGIVLLLNSTSESMENLLLMAGVIVNG